MDAPGNQVDNREAIIVGLDPEEADAVSEALSRAAIPSRRGALSACLHPDVGLVVIDIRSHHPLLGGLTGWQLVRHLLACERAVVVIGDPSARAPHDLEGSPAVSLTDFDPGEIAARCDSMWARQPKAA